MSKPRFIDIHALQTLPYSNPNRDDQGSPKTLVFGGSERSRISSQSWKRVIRHKVESLLGDPAVRTRRVVFEVSRKLQQRGWTEAEADSAGRQVARSVGKGIKLERAKDETDSEILTTSVLLYLPKSGMDELADIAADFREEVVAAEAKKSPKGVLPGDAIAEVLSRRNGTINLFGRMLAELPGANVDGAVQMAHAFTTHSTSVDYDFFAAVDDVEQEAGIPGSGHINTGLFTSGTFYRYANVDIEGLTKNLDEDEAMASQLITAFLDAFIGTIPRGKSQPTAPMTIPDLVQISVRADRPTSMAAAFEHPVARGDGFTLASVQRLDSYSNQVNKLLGSGNLLWGGLAGTEVVSETQHLGVRIDAFPELIRQAVSAAVPGEPS